MFRQPIDFVARQTRNFKVMLVGFGIYVANRSLTETYIPLYVKALGADYVQLGWLNSAGTAVNAALSSPLGWIGDRYGMKKVVLLGLMFSILVPVICLLAIEWWMLIPAIILSSTSTTLIYVFSDIIFVNNLRGKERATGLGFTRTFSGLLSIPIPLIAAFIVASFGGISIAGIRPLFYVYLVVVCIVFLLILTQLKRSNRKVTVTTRDSSFSRDFRHLFKEGIPLKRWFLINVSRHFGFGMISPFIPIFAMEMKGADPFVLGGMDLAMSVVYTIFSIPIGRLVDKIGRKKGIYLTRPFYYVFLLLLMFAPSSEYLIGAGFFRGLFWASTTLFVTMGMELVPTKLRGRWVGFNSLLVGFASLPAPIVGGILYQVNPLYMFFTAILIDVLFLLPTLATIPETLNVQLSEG